MARGLSKKPIPLLVNGAIDTKTNPKLVQPGALLELENLYQLRTGEMTPRNGFSLLPTPEGNLSNSGGNLFVTKNGGLGTIGLGGGSASDRNTRVLRYGNSITGREGWAENVEDVVGGGISTPPQSFPNVTAVLTGIPPAYDSGGAPISVVDPDMCLSGGAQHVAWGNGVAAKVFSDLRDPTTGRQIVTGALLTPALSGPHPTVTASTGGNWSALFYCPSVNHLSASGHNEVTQTSTNLSLAADLSGLFFFDVKAIPGTSKFAVAYKTNAAGIKCGIYDPAANTFTSIVATAGADASFCLGFLDDQFSTGNMYLATVGSGSGVVVRTMSATTMVVSATTTIDAGAVANIRNVTGHLYASGKYVVMWDISGLTTIADGMRMASYNGVGVSGPAWVGGPHTLYSRSVKFADGKYRVLGAFISLQGASMYTLFLCDTLGADGVISVGVQCHLMQGEAPARRSICSLTTPVLSNGVVTMVMSRARSIVAPDGSKGIPVTTAAIASFTTIGKPTHAREVGGTVFIPGGIVYRDDGATFETATFPIAPEAPTGSSSAAGGSMTASGSYSYRVVFKTSDATGRAPRSAGSTVFAITLGAGDNRVTLAVWGLSLPRSETNTGISGFGQVMAEIYRRGPAASGATLYNKVGEVLADTTPAAPTVTFVDTMSDINAAAGEVAYFNGNVLENFNPPAHTLLEVNANRVGVVNAEDPTEFWFSKEYKAGYGIGFNPLLKVQISGDGAGGITALGATAGRWYLFKKTATYVMSGDGPNDLGQGSFNAPQALSRSIGCVNPISVIETPDGLMFQAQTGGIWVIGEQGLQYIGAPVEAYALAETVTGAALNPNGPTVRFILPSGRMLEWDYFHKRWYTHTLRVNDDDVVDCVSSPIFGFCFMFETGDVMREMPGQTTDQRGGTFVIIPRVSFPHLNFAGLAGYQRLHAISYTVDVLGNHTLSADAEYNYSGAVTGTPRTIALTTATPTAQVEYNPPEGLAKSTSARPVLTVSGVPAGATFRLTGAAALVSVKRGSNVPAESRMR